MCGHSSPKNGVKKVDQIQAEAYIDREKGFRTDIFVTRITFLSSFRKFENRSYTNMGRKRGSEWNNKWGQSQNKGAAFSDSI